MQMTSQSLFASVAILHIWRLVLAGILEKRQSLHRRLVTQENANHTLQGEVVHLRSLANLGLVTAMAAHEINNVLTPVSSYAQLAMSHPDDEELGKKAIAKAAFNTLRASDILKSMLSMASGNKPYRDRYSVKELVDEVFSCIGRDLSKDNIRLCVDIDRRIMVYGERVGVQQVLMNLILNARESMLEGASKGGELSIKAGYEGDSVSIEISDTGCGISHSEQSKIFDAFYSTKSKSSGSGGSGLGLAFCRQIIDSHGGEILVESEPCVGTVFKVILPRH